jgi:hypothetical protein
MLCCIGILAIAPEFPASYNRAPLASPTLMSALAPAMGATAREQEDA